MFLINYGGMNTSFSDSDKSALVVFFGGCPYLCDYCHNKDIRDIQNYINVEHVESLIAESSQFVSEVIFSGGEPLAQIQALEHLLRFVKSLGLQAGIETSGYSSHEAEYLLEFGLIDTVYLDFKTSPQKYKELTGYKYAFFEMQNMLYLCRKHGIKCVVRTTLDPEWTNSDIINQISRIMQGFGFEYKTHQKR